MMRCKKKQLLNSRVTHALGICYASTGVNIYDLLGLGGCAATDYTKYAGGLVDLAKIGTLNQVPAPKLASRNAQRQPLGKC
jgi:hypothetical protein